MTGPERRVAASRITRRPGPVRVEGIQAQTLEGLVACAGPTATWLVADLSLGAGRAHQAAAEMAGQLGQPAPAAATGLADRQLQRIESFKRWASGTPDAGGSYADIIGEWIDNEAWGDRTVLRALALAERTLDAVQAGQPRSVLILTPRSADLWEAEDRWFLTFLAQGLRRPHRLMLVHTARDAPGSTPGFEVRWSVAPEPACAPTPVADLAALVPGLLEPGTAVKLGASSACLRLAGGSALVPPESRLLPTRVSRLEYDRLAASATSPWLRAYAQCLGNNLHVDPAFLCAQAHRQLEEGGHGIALRLLERAIACTRSPEEKAGLQTVAQGWRIALQRYREAAEAAEPSPALPPLLRGALLQLKGWGLVMMNRPQEADRYMLSATELLAPSLAGRREYLYLRNISALNLVGQGDLERPMTVEKEIEAAAARLAERDFRLEYVNAINIARLHRRRGEFAEAEEYYTRAFATTLGARSESDAVYTNVCWARLKEGRDGPAAAFTDWLRASLHWAAAEAPEALGWRPLSAIVGRRVVPGEDVSEEASRALARSLRAAAAAHGLASAGDGSASAAPVPALLRIEHADPLPAGALEAVGAPGWGVFLCTAEAAPAFEGEAARELRSLLWSLVRELGLAEEAASPAALLIDDRLGHEMPGSAAELVASGLWWNASRACFAGRRLTLDEHLRARLGEARRVRLGRAVARADLNASGGTVVFKRYRPPRPLSAEESSVVAHLGGEPSLVELWSAVGAAVAAARRELVLRGLARDRVLETWLPDGILEGEQGRRGTEARRRHGAASGAAPRPSREERP